MNRDLHRLENLEQRQLLSAEIVVTDSVSPADDFVVTFPNTIAQTPSSVKTFSLRNDGDAGLVISNFGFTGHTSDFDIYMEDSSRQILDDPNATIPAGETYKILCQFIPTRAGARLASITFNTNDPDPDDATWDLGLGGTGLAPAPTGPTNGNVVLSSTSPTSQVKISWADTSTSELGFRVYVTTTPENEEWPLLRSVGPNVTTATISGLTSYTRYYFAVAAFNAAGDSSTYAEDDVRTKAVVETKPNNTLGTATDAGSLTGPVTYNNYVGSSDTVDYYKLRLSATGRIRAEFADVAGSVTAQLIRKNTDGTTTVLTGKAGSTPLILTKTGSPAGTYYLRIARTGSDRTGYKLKLTADYAGNVLASPRNLGTVKTANYYDSLGLTDSNDYYKFTVTGSKTVTLRLSGFTTDLDLTLLDSKGTQIAVSENEDLSTDEITRTLSTGTYYVRVQPYQAMIDSRYKLSVAVG